MNRTLVIATLAMSTGLAACGGDGGDPPGGAQPGGSRYVLLSNVEKSAFVGTWDGARPGTYTNAAAYEVAVYSFVFANGTNVIVTQNRSSDEILQFKLGADGGLTPGAKLHAPTKAVPGEVLFASPDLAFVNLIGAGKVWAFNPNDMALVKEIDFTGPTYTVSAPGANDINPDPGAMAIRDGKLYVLLTQMKNDYASHPGLHVAIVDLATYKVEKVIVDMRLAASGGEVDRMFVDEAGDLYVYGGASYGFEPTQAHGWLLIKKGATEFDPDYVFDLKAATLEVPGGRIDYLNHEIYGGNGLVYCVADVPALASNPPDYAKDHTMQPVVVDLRARTIKKLPLPLSNGYSGAVALDGGTLLAALAAAEGVGIFALDLSTATAPSAPAVSTQGYVSSMSRIK